MRPRRALIVDGYNDEPGGLGVPPYIDVYPRYIAGALWAADKSTTVHYVTVDEFRSSQVWLKRASTYDVVFFVAGVVVPGKYIGGRPARAEELALWATLIEGPLKVLAGPAARWGLGIEGGRAAYPPSFFKGRGFDVLVTGDVEEFAYDLARYGEERASPHRIREDYKNVDRFAVLGAKIVTFHPNLGRNLVAELETYRGCARWVSGGCSFCVEPLRGRPLQRDPEAIAKEVEALYNNGVRHFRLGRQADILVYGSPQLGYEEWPRPSPEALERLFLGIRHAAPGLKVLHIDNVNPGTIARYPRESEEALKVIVKYHTSGDVAALGIETVDPRVVKLNNLKVTYEEALFAVELINKVGSQRGPSGLPELLPGINFILGLPGETAETYRMNREFLEEILRRRLMVRRVNVRKILALEVTRVFKMEWGVKPRLEGHAESFVHFVRQVFDVKMLSLVAPPGVILRDLWVEECEGSLCYARQAGSYPLMVVLKGPMPRLTYLPAVMVKGVHSSRSVEGVVAETAIVSS
ncbi:MAG: radical SAM protein [Acidilobus sp.]